MSEKDNETFTAPVTGRYKVSQEGIKLIEMNEDNCVLGENDLKHINHALEDFVEMNDVNRKARKWAERKREKLFQKINKLNELAKEKQNERG